MGTLQNTSPEFIATDISQVARGGVLLISDFVARPGTGLSDTRHAQPLAGTARSTRPPRSVVEGSRPGPRPTRHDRDRRRNHRHLGNPAPRRCRCSAGIRGNRITWLLGADVIAAGHSVGELAAAAVAGVISADDAVALAALRGAEMAKACSLEPTGMSAVLGGDEAEVLARIEELGLEAANRNAAGQIVAAGLLTALEELAANAPEKARVRALPVAGAFHTRFMAPAQDAVAAAAAKITPSDPTRTLLSNSDGAPVSSGADALTKLAAQVTRPVRWDLCSASLRTAEVSAIVELPPAGTLVGIAKREMRGTPTVALKNPEDISALSELT